MIHNLTEQEQFIINILDKKKNGYYVELGAAHYSNGNNTFSLEKDYDWKGVSFEIISDGTKNFDNVLPSFSLNMKSNMIIPQGGKSDDKYVPLTCKCAWVACLSS